MMLIVHVHLYLLAPTFSYLYNNKVEEVPIEIYFIKIATENIIIKVPQKKEEKNNFQWHLLSMGFPL